MVEYRTFEPAMLAELTGVWNSSAAETPLFTPETVEQMEISLVRDPDFDPKRLFVAFKDGRMVGYGEGFVQRKRIEAGKSQGFVSAEVVPELRGQGIERDLMAKAVACLRASGIKEAIYWFHPAIPWRLSLAKGFAFTYQRSYHSMTVKLDMSTGEPSYPPGFSLEKRLAWDASHDYLVEWLGAKDASFVDHFNSAPTDPESFWPYRDLKEEAIEYILARDSDGKPAGVCMSSVEEVEDKKVAWLTILGVLPAHRRKGLARALLADGLAWMRSRGALEAHIGVDAKNEKSLPLYRSVGFEVDSEAQTWVLQL